jgi:hypothetical protein
MTRREREVWSLHDKNTGILAIAEERFKAPTHINHSLSHGELSVRSQRGIVAERWFEQITKGRKILMRAAVSRFSRH